MARAAASFKKIVNQTMIHHRKHPWLTAASARLPKASAGPQRSLSHTWAAVASLAGTDSGGGTEDFREDLVAGFLLVLGTAEVWSGVPAVGATV